MKLSMPELPSATLLTALGAYNLLPAIVFLPTRRRCDQAASEAAFARRDPNPERIEARREFMSGFVREHPEVRSHRHWDTIIRGAVASHHAGHIPAWKLAIEKLMSTGLLDAIFATATVAAGVDFPARSVVLSGADQRTGSGWRQLTASELQQMTGRAGRRGKDNVGFIVAAPGLHQDPESIAKLLKSSPDPLVSQFRATYTTLLNLLDAYGSFPRVREIAEKSFAHREAARGIARLEKDREQSRGRVETRLKEASCELPVSAALGLERLVSARARLEEARPQTRAEMLLRWLDEAVQPGRVIGIGRSGKRLVLVTDRREGNVLGLREDGRRVTLALERIGPVYSRIYPLREQFIEEAFAEVHTKGRELLLPEPRLRDAQTEGADAVNLFNQVIDSLTPADLSEAQKRTCVEALWATLADAEAIERADRQIASLREEVWKPFERRAQVLATLGYLDFEAERVTARTLAGRSAYRQTPAVGEALEVAVFVARHSSPDERSPR
jgi:hypothetical protein